MSDKIRLVKNQTIRLKKVTDALKEVRCGMGWKPSSSGHSWDLDQSIIVVDDDGRVVKEISYREPEHSREFHYHGDDLYGGSGGRKDDDEKIDINFPKLDPSYDRIIVIMNIYEALRKSQDLSMVKNAYIHLWDVDAKKDLVEYPIEKTDKFKGKTGMFVGEFRKKDGEWEFQAIGEPVRVERIADMVEIIRRKNSKDSTANQSWEEFLAQYSQNEQQVRGDSRQKGFFGRLFS